MSLNDRNMKTFNVHKQIFIICFEQTSIKGSAFLSLFLKEVMQVEVSIHELLAAAREAVKSDYIKGESILCETRYHPDTHYMVEIEMLKTDNTLGKKGAYIRKFLTEVEYSSMLQKQEEHLIKIKRQAIVQKGTLRYIPLPDRLDSRRKRDIF